MTSSPQLKAARRSGWRLAALEDSRVVTAGERTSQSRVELAEAERSVNRVGAQLRTYSEQSTYVQADIDALSARLATVEADRRRLQDLKRIRTLGSDLGVSVLSDDLCPTCLQELDHRHVATGEVATVEATLTLGDAERTTLTDMRTVAEHRLEDLTRARDALSQQLDFARGQVRLLRDELVSESAAPSLVEVREQLWLRDRIAGAHRVAAMVETADEELNALAARNDDLRAQIKGLEDQPASKQDLQILADFNQRFRNQLNRYGLVSLPVEQISIDSNTLMPTDNGVELRFDITVGMSASDTIRTKWAYYVALMEVATASATGHHAGLLIFDEPRQQETAMSSLSALITELGAAAQQGSQILYATSGDEVELNAVLVGVPHYRLPAPGNHLLLPV
jgi:prefoldin subunit 5